MQLRYLLSNVLDSLALSFTMQDSADNDISTSVACDSSSQSSLQHGLHVAAALVSKSGSAMHCAHNWHMYSITCSAAMGASADGTAQSACSRNSRDMIHQVLHCLL